MQRFNQWLTSIALSLLVWAGLIVSESALNAPPARAEAAPLSSSLVAYLPPGNAITDGKALLRYALPIDNEDIRKVQEDLEGLSKWLRSK
ncbi:MAG: peptidylprolyl isomerase, partial [Leptolyngbyaceae cyanobacterium]